MDSIGFELWSWQCNFVAEVEDPCGSVVSVVEDGARGVRRGKGLLQLIDELYGRLRIGYDEIAGWSDFVESIANERGWELRSDLYSALYILLPTVRDNGLSHEVQSLSDSFNTCGEIREVKFIVEQ